MPFIQEHGLEVYLICFCINGMVGFGIAATGINIYSPFDITTPVTAVDIPQALNRTNPNNLLANVTTNIENATSSNWFITAIQNSFSLFFQYTYVFILFISGGFIWSFFAILGMPQDFVYILEGVVIIFLARTAYYYVTGK